MMPDLEHRPKRLLGQPTMAFRLLYYLLIVIASGLLIGILYLGSLPD